MSSPPSPPIAERIKHLNGNHLKMEFKRNHLSNIYSQHSDDEDIEYEMETVSSISNSKSMKKRNSTKKKKNTLTRRKYKKYSPPKHIQQKINIHKEIRRLSLSSSSIETERSNQNNNNKKRKLSISKSENNNISKPSLIEQTETKSFSFSFSSTHSHSQSSLEYIDHNYYNNNSATTCFEPSSIDSQGIYSIHLLFVN